MSMPEQLKSFFKTKKSKPDSKLELAADYLNIEDRIQLLKQALVDPDILKLLPKEVKKRRERIKRDIELQEKELLELRSKGVTDADLRIIDENTFREIQKQVEGTNRILNEREQELRNQIATIEAETEAKEKSELDQLRRELQEMERQREILKNSQVSLDRYRREIDERYGTK